MSKTGFFAYPNTPTHCGEFIERAITVINQETPDVALKSWKQLEIGGNFIISKILRQIETSDFVCADVTHINENVLFELGFAIGKRKPVWIIQDTSIGASFAKFRELNFLTSVGYCSYTSSTDIVNGFTSENVNLKSSLLIDQLVAGISENTNRNALLFLKTQFDTDYNQLMIEKIRDLKLPCIIDDANEVRIQSLTWYITQLLSVPAVLVEFSSIRRIGQDVQNAKCSFIAGLALGLGLRVQMVAEEPFPTALDYQEYLRKFSNLKTCEEAISPFLNRLQLDSAELIVKNNTIVKSQRHDSVLQKIKFGEYIAEHESEGIYDYYINAAHEENIIKSEYNIVVGRKGSGKTATLYFLQSYLGRDIRNQIVTIKPINFEIDGLIQLLKKLNSEFERGYIIQSIWKFLIYTEIAKRMYHIVINKPVYAIEKLDKEIIEFVEANKAIILTDFSTRLEQELINLEATTIISEQTEFREKISEILHDNIIGKLKEMIISFMMKRNKLVIIIDNLDKNWRKDKEIEITSKFILGLLGVIGRIVKELKGNPRKPNFDMNLIVLLRSDIFKHIMQYAREPDKIEYTRLRWNDTEVLFRIVDKRIEYLSDETITGEDFWRNYVTHTTKNIPTKNFIHSCIIPRPRDLIFFLNGAKSKAVARGHRTIEENDIIAAYEDYSSWIFQSILVENGITIKQMETFLYNTIGENSVISRGQIIKLMVLADINTDEINVDYFIDFLCSLSFIGREIREDEFEYEYDFETDIKIKILSKKINSNRYKIHNAFIPFLECIDYKSNGPRSAYSS